MQFSTIVWLGKTHISSPMDSHINTVTNITRVYHGQRLIGLLLLGVALQACRSPRVLGCLSNAMVGQNRRTTGWEWPHDLTVISATDLATFCGI